TKAINSGSRSMTSPAINSAYRLIMIAVVSSLRRSFCWRFAGPVLNCMPMKSFSGMSTLTQFLRLTAENAGWSEDQDEDQDQKYEYVLVLRSLRHEHDDQHFEQCEDITADRGAINIAQAPQHCGGEPLDRHHPTHVEAN